jgi:1-acyl-sn-glycerol-3-phosphate acyltransferase
MAFDLRTLLAPLLRWRATSAEGLDFLPLTGPALLVANHVGQQDPQALVGIILARTHRLPYVIAKWKIFAHPLVRRIAHTIPLYAERSQTMAETQRVLEHGGLVCIYPEGGVGTLPTIGRVKTGAARLALATRVPVIPVGIQRVHRVPRTEAEHTRDLLVGRVRVAFGQPVDLTPWYGLTVDRPLLDKVNAAMMTRVAQLAGKTYTG